MLFRRVALALVLPIMVLAPIVGAEDGQSLVLKDGTAIEVAQMLVRSGRVEVHLPNGQLQAYDVGDVDLEASGLLAEKPATEPVPETQAMRRGTFGAAIAAESTGQGGVMITDQDVKHVKRRPVVLDEEGEEADTEADSQAGKTMSLVVSDLSREASGESLWVSGRVFNSGDRAVTAITMTAVAQDTEGATLGQGTKTIGGTLNAGDSAEFLISIPGSGAAANVRVTASAAISEFSFEEIPNPGAEDRSDEES